jgi:hypothetical protein
MKKNIIKEATGTGSSGRFKVPIVLAPQPWEEEQLAPFTDALYKYTNATKLMSKINMEKKKSYRGQNDEEGSAMNPTMSGEPLKEKLLKEDLAVWFGTKKKPKGSKQPKGPWVNICRKKEGGGHPPCGRPEADSKGYPKCRAAGVASKMTDSQKKSACSQKRRAEKANPKSGTGNKPTMVSYKPKKSQNESLRDLISKVVKENFK